VLSSFLGFCGSVWNVRAAARTVGGAPVSIATGASAQSTGLMRVSGLNCIDRDSDNDGGSEKHSQKERGGAA